MIKVILWDIDGTLLDFKASEVRAIEKCFEIFDLGKCSEKMLSDYNKINTRYWKMLELGLKSKEEILVERFICFFEKYGLDLSKAEAFNREYQLQLGNFIYFYEGAYDIVNGLRGEYLQAAVTNGTKVAQVKKLKNSGLDKLFDYIFISEDIGIEKPNLGIFENVLDKIGNYKLDEILIVGDSLTSDIKGGNNIGIKTCWFNPSGKLKNEDVQIDYEISKLDEIYEIIKI